MLPEGEAIEETKDKVTGAKCVQAGTDKGDQARDEDTIVNNPGAFAAE